MANDIQKEFVYYQLSVDTSVNSLIVFHIILCLFDVSNSFSQLISSIAYFLLSALVKSNTNILIPILMIPTKLMFYNELLLLGLNRIF